MNQRWKLAHVFETLKDPKYWVILVFGICQSITNAGITNVSSPLPTIPISWNYETQDEVADTFSI